MKGLKILACSREGEERANTESVLMFGMIIAFFFFYF